MYYTIRKHAWILFCALCCTLVVELHATPGLAQAATDSHEGEWESPEAQDLQDPQEVRPRHRDRHHRSYQDVFDMFDEAHLDAGERAGAVTSIFGAAVSEGEANDVVSVFGDARATGPVHDSVVSIFGSTYVDASVGGDVTSIFGTVNLGPAADIDGEVVSIFGHIARDAGAQVHGGVTSIFGRGLGSWRHGDSRFGGWLDDGLLKGRLLGWQEGQRWTWVVAAAFLAFYALLAVLFPGGIRECVRTIEMRPAATLLAALLAVLCTPVIIVLLVVTIIGIAAVPFVLLALFVLSLFGKAVMLAWIGQRLLGGGAPRHVAGAVLLGGTVVALLYLVPVLGIVVYKVLGIIGLGAVLYTILSGARERQAIAAAASPNLNAGVAAATAGAAAASAVPPPQPPPPPPPGDAPSARVPPSSPLLPKAGFWIRMGALFLDVLLVGIIAGVVLDPHGHQIHVVLLAAYGAVMWKLRGSTVGGIACNLQVVRIDGRELDWETAIVRALSCFLSLAVFGLGFIWIAFDPAGQAWHDKIAGTVVVRVPRIAAAS